MQTGKLVMQPPKLTLYLKRLLGKDFVQNKSLGSKSSSDLNKFVSDFVRRVLLDPEFNDSRFSEDKCNFFQWYLSSFQTEASVTASNKSSTLWLSNRFPTYKKYASQKTIGARCERFQRHDKKYISKHNHFFFKVQWRSCKRNGWCPEKQPF